MGRRLEGMLALVEEVALSEKRESWRDSLLLLAWREDGGET
jgi:hypothetical protein